MKKYVSATVAKNRFGHVMKMAESEAVYIVKHGKARTVVVDAGHYDALVQKGRSAADQTLDALRAEFEALCAAMQKPPSRKAVDRLLTASSEELNRVAARGIRRTRAQTRR